MSLGFGIRRNLSAEQRAALDRVGKAYKAGRINFDTAVELRDLIREGQISQARALLACSQIPMRDAEVVS